jgi:serine protease AprX
VPLLAIVVGTAGARDARVVNDYLEDVMSTWPAGQDIEVLVRFVDSPTFADRIHLEQAGLQTGYAFHVVPAIAAVGSPESVWRASLDPRVVWIEWNRPMDPFMQNSTTVVNATRVWDAFVEDQSLSYPTIDGTGGTVVVVDTGVDAGHPDLENRFLLNLQKGHVAGEWDARENTDAGGHGTHVAGTVAGDGTASAGARRGVAPGANLIALAGFSYVLQYLLEALEWVYDNSHPGNNPYNIRCATNSWGSAGAPYDPNDAITVVTEKLTYENNVVVTFAAGNSGREDHDGSTLTTNIYANTPAAISVAAYVHDGTGLASFSSRGLKADNATWPDFGAPGVEIFSTRARMTSLTRTQCTNSITGPNPDCDPYYFAVSGTSMSTPHVAGEVALLFQAAPSLRVSDYHADFGNDPNTSAEDLANWFTNPRTRMHEVEVILKLTAHFLENGTNSAGVDRGIPLYDNWTGFAGRPHDWGQGYGIADMNAAVSLALTLQKMRSMNPDTTVLDAYYQWKGLREGGQPVAHDQVFEGKTDTLVTGWGGLYSRYNDQFGKPMFIQNATKWVFVPNGTTQLDLDLTYETFNLDDGDIGTVTWQVELPDGSTRMGPWLGGRGHRTATLSDVASQAGATWQFSVVGEGVRLQHPGYPAQYQEIRLRFSYGVTAKIETSPDAPVIVDFVDHHAQYAQWHFLDNGTSSANGSIILTMAVFDLKAVQGYWGAPPRPGGPIEAPWWLLLLAGLALAAAGLYLANERRVKMGKPPPPWIEKGRALLARGRPAALLGLLRNPGARLRLRAGAGPLRRVSAGLRGLRRRIPLRPRSG